MRKGIIITVSAVTFAVCAIGAVIYKRHLDERNRLSLQQNFEYAS